MKRGIKLLFSVITAGIFIMVTPGYYPQISDVNDMISIIQKAT